MNNITLMGRLTDNPELRHTQNDIAVTSFTLAVDRDYTPKGQEKQTDFINIVAWRSTAEFVTRYFHKGQRVALVGSLQSRKYVDKDGNNRVAYEVVANAVYFADSKQGENLSSQAQNTPQNEISAQSGAVTGGDFEEIVGDSDLLF